MKTVGILALQGAFIEHKRMIESLGHNAVEVRKASQLDEIDGLILPGGESTAMGKLLRDFQMLEPLKNAIQAKLPVWGTCAGMILLADQLADDPTTHLQSMNITVKRNAYGRQLDSFCIDAHIPEVSDFPFPLVFIRAPYIVNHGDNVEVLHTIDDNVVAVKQGHMLATSFHPELTDDARFHEYFISMIP